MRTSGIGRHQTPASRHLEDAAGSFPSIAASFLVHMPSPPRATAPGAWPKRKPKRGTRDAAEPIERYNKFAGPPASRQAPAFPPGPVLRHGVSSGPRVASRLRWSCCIPARLFERTLPRTPSRIGGAANLVMAAQNGVGAGAFNSRPTAPPSEPPDYRAAARGDGDRHHRRRHRPAAPFGPPGRSPDRPPSLGGRCGDIGIE